MTEPVVRITDLHKSFGDNQVLRGIDMEVARGEVVVVFGRSGSGKSTLLRCINFLEEPTAGTIEVGGVRVEPGPHTRRQREIIRSIRIKAGMVFQDFNLFPHLTALENVIEAPITVKGEQRDHAVEKGRMLLAQVGLRDKEDEHPIRLSGGQKQRVAIARLFLKDPPVIFLDEPTASLDAIATEQIKNSLDAIKVNRTTVIISHSISQIIDSDVIYVLKEGRVVEIGTHDELYDKRGTYFEIFNASARSLNLDKIAQTLEA